MAETATKIQSRNSHHICSDPTDDRQMPHQPTVAGMLHESFGHEGLKSSLAFRITASLKCLPPAARPGLTAPRLASSSMAVKDSAHSEPCGALCSISCQLSAAESRLPTCVHSARAKTSAMSTEAIG